MSRVPVLDEQILLKPGDLVTCGLQTSVLSFICKLNMMCDHVMLQSLFDISVFLLVPVAEQVCSYFPGHVSVLPSGGWRARWLLTPSLRGATWVRALAPPLRGPVQGLCEPASMLKKMSIEVQQAQNSADLSL
uniref:Uncharacterized protein n=1 Tax=Arundo donax TaxID=35708 RepID=A0A0A9F4D5_ARUDO